MGNFLSAALRGHLPEAALLPLLLVIVIMGVLASACASTPCTTSRPPAAFVPPPSPGTAVPAPAAERAPHPPRAPALRHVPARSGVPLPASSIIGVKRGKIVSCGPERGLFVSGPTGRRRRREGPGRMRLPGTRGRPILPARMCRVCSNHAPASAEASSFSVNEITVGSVDEGSAGHAGSVCAAPAGWWRARSDYPHAAPRASGRRGVLILGFPTERGGEGL